MKRRFETLREPPAERYDAVVIGAGLGGLLAGCLLARAGRRVLLLEQHYMVGGYCSTFRRAGYTFDAATHFYPALGNEESRIGRILLDLGVGVEWKIMDPVDVFHFPDGSEFTVPADFDRYRERLDAEFPQQKDALDCFFDDVRSLYLHGALAYFRRRETPKFLEWEERTLWQELERRFDDPKLRLLLTADCPHWGSPPERVSFVFDCMLRMTYFLGNYYPKGSSQAFADELARIFVESGGDLLTSTAARRIEVRDGSVRAVEAETVRGSLRGPHRVLTDLVLSNADWHLTFDRLLQDVPEARAWAAEAEGLRPSHPCYLVHLGLEGVDAATLDAIQGYWWDRWDPNAMARGGLRCKVFVPTLYDPDVADPGHGEAARDDDGPERHVVILQKVWAVDYDALEAEGSGAWEANKAEIHELGFAHLESLVPGIRDHVVTAQTASARTSWHFTRNHRGAMLGWEMSPDQLGRRRPATTGPVGGLHLVGHWTRPGGGIVPVLESALRVAEDVLGEDPVPALRSAPPAAVPA